jgi:dGTPase
MLAPYACDAPSSRGRRHAEAAAPTRDDFQRDRDRVVHSTAFRRLVYKTQVFLNHEGDLFRTRLTHSIEVAQIGRSIARQLRLNEDLVEALALAHDVGHTPFGHAGQDALHSCMKEADPASAGFEHNFQSLRVVDGLEERYAAFDGLNLCFETREGILKHCARRNAEWLERIEPGGVGHRFIARTQPSLEAQLCNLADEIAYNAHDVDDGVRSGLISFDEACSVPLVDRFRQDALTEHPTLAGRRLLFETIRRMLSAQIYDLIDHSNSLIRRHRPESVDDVRRMPALVQRSAEIEDEHLRLKTFLRERLYRHPQVVDTTDRAKTIVATLFRRYMEEPAEMPKGYSDRPRVMRSVADYIAGMTDRFAIKEHERLTGERIFEDR